MVRFIFVCMALVALTLVSIPVRSVYDGLQDQRTAALETQTPEQLAEATPETTDDIFAAFDVPEEPSADDLNAIATAAGGFEGTIEEDAGFGAGFSDTAPAALADTPAPQTEPDTTAN